jgi:ribosomal protein S4
MYVQQTNANIRLNPGDMVSVDPSAMTILTRKGAFESPPEAEKSSEVSSETGEENPKTASTSISPSPQKDKFRFPVYASPFLFLPAYIEANFSTCSAVYVRHPTARPGYSEIPTPYDADGEVVRFAWEWYSKRRPRSPKPNSKWKSPELARS